LPSAGAVGSVVRGASVTTEGGEGRGHIVVAAHLQLVVIGFLVFVLCFEV